MVLFVSRTGWYVEHQADDLDKIILTCDLELSLTVPITNSLAFLFTVLGEWCVDGKAISKGSFLADKI